MAEESVGHIGGGRASGPSPASVDAALSWLRRADDPTADLLLATRVDGRDLDSCDDLVEAVVATERVQSVLAAQNVDGSWGPPDTDDRRRILRTLHTLHTLAVLGAGHDPGAERAIEFLSAAAHVDGGVFSIDGRREGVLSCYVGTAAAAYLLCGRLAVAQHQIDWMRRHQEVSRDGASMRRDTPELWGGYLRTRYGGCMAATTCLVGLAKVGRALQLQADLVGDAARIERVEPLRAAIREVFLERRLMFDSWQRVVPLGVAPSKASDWLLPSFPLDWHTDLIEVLGVVAGSGPFDPRMQPAIDLLESWQLPDGSWPLRRSFWPDDLAVRERRNAKRGSAIVTMRATLALRACQDDR